MPAILLFLMLLHVPSGALTFWAAGGTSSPAVNVERDQSPTTDIHLGWDPNGPTTDIRLGWDPNG